ncbi:hypothetical protein M9H77_11702 [Catharanthus roseus]|uniref:Uncharacterized protein n=1 Tax=Catharanthus roseus TaxID=4058 RepID=A0ACC0BFE8_CATRO|nr:hypothetical protein M9H77_11702 [Catharanthus roseus]
MKRRRKRSKNDENGSRRQSSRNYRGWQGNLLSTVGAKNAWEAETRDLLRMVGLTLPSVVGIVLEPLSVHERFGTRISSFDYPMMSLKLDILPSIAKMTHSDKMAITCTIRIKLRRFKIHWESQRILYKFSEDTKNQFECFEGKKEPITKEMQNCNRKAKTEPTGDAKDIIKAWVLGVRKRQEG